MNAINSYLTRLSLIEGACKGDGNALNELCKYYKPMIVGRLVSKGLQHADAVDVCQEVLTCLIGKFPEFEYDSTGTFRGFISYIIHFKLLEHWRLKRRQNVNDSFAQDYLNCQENLAEIVDLIVKDSSRAQMQLLIAKTKQSIEDSGWDKQNWNIWLLRYIKSLKPKEIACQLNLSAGTVYQVIHRVNKRFRKKAEELKITLADFDAHLLDVAEIENEGEG